MLRNALLVSVAIPALALAGMARAQVEVSDERTTPIATSTVDGGSAGDLIIRSAGSVLVDSGAAITLDSDNTVTNEGTIGSNDADNTTGILISGGSTGAFTNSGSINLLEDFTPTDDDDDGDLDGPFATGTGRTGVLVEGSAPFTGDISNDTGGSITVEGTQSAGIRITAGLDGNLNNDGSVTVTGADGYGVHIAGTVNGDISNSGSISVKGANSIGLGIDADVNGAVSNTGTIGSTGFRETTRRNSATERAKLDADDLAAGGAAVSISASISGGFVNGTVLDANGNPSRSGQIASQGSAPAILVTAGLNGAAGNDITLGAVGSAADGRDFGLINDGTITASGLNDGFAATAISVQGAQVGNTLRRAILEHGILNSGTILGSSFEASTHTLWIRNGGVADTVSNSGTVRSTVVSQSGGEAVSVAVEAGGQVSTVSNTGAIEASYTG
ncbi:MAG TPA: autotransporter domain-containing protein, partial [Rhizobiales bacterium]|nr:autotransporter domain-containing protein [Hyphomicrobiales bacterium]